MFLNKLNKFNQNISYIIFSLNGYFALYPFIALSLEKIGYEIYLLYMLIAAIYCFAGIIWCIEQIIEYKLPFAFLKHISCTIVFLLGAIISTIYLCLLAIFFVFL